MVTPTATPPTADIDAPFEASLRRVSAPHAIAAPVRRSAPPPLNAGDHLTRTEFGRRYRAQPALKKAELLEGVVYMPSPVHLQVHAQPHSDIVGWLAVYRAMTPGVYAADNATVHLDSDNEVQPDALLRLDEALGGHSRLTEDDFLAGAPELIIEVAASSAAYDLHEKLKVYRRNGVQEYLVLVAYEQETHWYALTEGAYELLAADEHGVLCSQVFPGLWLDVQRFWEGDFAGVLAVLYDGLKSNEHTALVQRLQTTLTPTTP